MELDGTEIAPLTRIKLRIEGQPRPGARYDWRGVATCEEPFVSILFIAVEGAVRWGKSAPSRAGLQEISLGFFAHAQSDRFGQLGVSMPGVTHAHAVMLPSASYRPDLPASLSLETGTIRRFAAVDASARVDVLTLFLAARDVKVGRNRLWHVRPALAQAIEGPIQRILTYGRTGTFELAHQPQP